MYGMVFVYLYTKIELNGWISIKVKTTLSSLVVRGEQASHIPFTSHKTCASFQKLPPLYQGCMPVSLPLVIYAHFVQIPLLPSLPLFICSHSPLGVSLPSPCLSAYIL
jgi:hypothetical protein